MSTIVISPILPRKYSYTVRQFRFLNNALQPIGLISKTISALEIELQTINHWWIFLAANYHDSFYHISFDPTKAIPTQVTGAVGEALALVVMQKLYSARNILRITPHPSSQSADFEMDIHENGKAVHALVESKGSNTPSHYPQMQTVLAGVSQLFSTLHTHPSGAGYLIITSYPARTCFVIKVF